MRQTILNYPKQLHTQYILVLHCINYIIFQVVIAKIGPLHDKLFVKMTFQAVLINWNNLLKSHTCSQQYNSEFKPTNSAVCGILIFADHSSILTNILSRASTAQSNSNYNIMNILWLIGLANSINMHCSHSWLIFYKKVHNHLGHRLAQPFNYPITQQVFWKDKDLTP